MIFPGIIKNVTKIISAFSLNSDIIQKSNTNKNKEKIIRTQRAQKTEENIFETICLSSLFLAIFRVAV